MKNVYVYCEGQTEESFVNEILSPYFANIDICVTPIICTTSRHRNKKFRGGVSNYDKIKSELILLCKQHHNEYVTTMFDYYAMPSNTPNIDDSTTDIYQRISNIEKAIESDIGMNNCCFNLMLHEFEGILFSNPSSFSLITNEDNVRKVTEMRESAKTPEHINNSPETAPSKRIEAIIPNYAKVKNGAILAKDMGIDVIMRECKHFAEWIEKIKNL